MSKWRYAAFALEQVLRNVLWSSSSWPRRMVTVAHRYTVRMASSHILGRSNQIPKFHLQSHLFFFKCLFDWFDDCQGIMDLINSYCHSVYLSVLMNPANQRGWSDLISRDLIDKFHSTLAKQTRNPILYNLIHIYVSNIYTYKFMFISSFETRWENGVMQGGLMEFDVRIHLYIYIYTCYNR